ncbi:methyltransferase domain-containing protein [Leeuwenhoekiella marinoflava]|uniref:methyltransferase domain-containing protein n=1 Tax=Leeuwenhoekiella marinoflava TaxID=988 RepID=UPI003003917D
MKTDLNKEYWENRYQNKKTGWNIGHISTPLKTYVDQLTDKSLNILIPGAGFGYEAQYLINDGFKDVTVIDFSTSALNRLQESLPQIPTSHFIEGNFFDHNGSYDLIIEQTFFCALQPELRADYAKKCSELLSLKGKLIGLLFDFPLTEEGPPFGGSFREYQQLFSEYFRIKTLERCYNSIKPRDGKELFFIFEKSITTTR